MVDGRIDEAHQYVRRDSWEGHLPERLPAGGPLHLRHLVVALRNGQQTHEEYQNLHAAAPDQIRHVGDHAAYGIHQSLGQPASSSCRVSRAALKMLVAESPPTTTVVRLVLMMEEMTPVVTSTGRKNIRRMKPRPLNF